MNGISLNDKLILNKQLYYCLLNIEKSITVPTIVVL